jgi:UDP-N-acetylglucosamine enolpyruvyl transferase
MRRFGKLRFDYVSVGETENSIMGSAAHSAELL